MCLDEQIECLRRRMSRLATRTLALPHWLHGMRQLMRNVVALSVSSLRRASRPSVFTWGPWRLTRGLEASMRRRHSTKQREIPALGWQSLSGSHRTSRISFRKQTPGRAIRVAEKNAPRGHYDAPQQHRSPVAGIMAEPRVTSIAVKMGETESQREKEYVASERQRKREPPLCCFL